MPTLQLDLLPDTALELGQYLPTEEGKKDTDQQEAREGVRSPWMALWCSSSAHSPIGQVFFGGKVVDVEGAPFLFSHNLPLSG